MSGGASSGGGRNASILPPNVHGVVVIAMNIAFAAAGLSLLYLLASIFFGHLDTWHQLPQKADRVRILNNIGLASQGLTFGLAVGSLCGALILLTEETAGYIMLAAAAAIGLGIPFGITSFGGEALQPGGKSLALNHAFGAFPSAALIPGGIAALLILRDVVLRFVNAVRSRPLATEKMSYGQGAKKETRPARLSILGKCWEGPYCREFIRVHCPVYIARAACWKQRRGCYCEEDIVSAAASKVQGTQLDMAPDQRYNFANAAAPASAAVRRPQLTEWQKRERCRHCVIYNEHQREKYRLLMPVVLVASIGICLLFSGALKEFLGDGMVAVEKIIRQASFFSAQDTKVAIGKPSGIPQYALIAALSVMLVSKALQLLEWAVFKLKI